MKAIYPGSFDPVTVGHENIIRRAAVLCEKLWVVVGVNPHKSGFLPIEERVRLLRLVCADLPNVEVVSWTGLTVKCAENYAADAIIRGIRSIGDMEFEENLAYYGQFFSGRHIETLYLSAEPEYRYVSSSMLKEALTYGDDALVLLPKAVREDALLLNFVFSLKSRSNH